MRSAQKAAVSKIGELVAELRVLTPAMLRTRLEDLMHEPCRSGGVRRRAAGTHIERIIVKTVAAFLNAGGGTLVIGVEDDGSVYALAEDYKLGGGKGRDNFENWLTQTLLKDFGKDEGGLLSTVFYELRTPQPGSRGTGMCAW